LIVDWLTSQFWITPSIVDWYADTVLLSARVGGTSIVVVTLSIDDTSNATFVLVAFSEPFCFVIIREQDKVRIKKGSILGARNRRISARVCFSIRRSCANIGCAFISIVTLSNISAESIVWQTDILGAWIFVIAIGIVTTFWCWGTAFLSISRADLAIVPKVRIGVRSQAVAMMFTLVSNTLS